MRKNAIEKDDFFIGQKLRQRRSELGISQSKLAKIEKLTFQQIQKYESGKNRISASRLYRFATILHVPITYFYDGLGEIDEIDANVSKNDKLTQLGIRKLNKYYLTIKNPKLKKAVVSLAKQISEADDFDKNVNKNNIKKNEKI